MQGKTAHEMALSNLKGFGRLTTTKELQGELTRFLPSVAVTRSAEERDSA